jgi:4-hydroxy-tetrahydrodipicolinate synthase
MPTPFSADGSELALDRIQPVCDYLLNEGVQGVFICGTTGEGPSLTAEEKLSVIQETVRAMNGRGKIIAQVASANQHGTLKTARLASKMGVDAISLLQPWFYSCDEEAQYQYIARVAEALDGFPLYLYNIPQCTTNDLPASVLERLRGLYPNIAGLKESSTAEKLNSWFRFNSEEFQVIPGIDHEVCNSFQKGSQALIASTANYQGKLFATMLEHARKNDWEAAHGVQRQISRGVEALNGQNVIACIKEFFRMKGIDIGSVRLPLRSLNEEEKRNWRKNLKELNLID